MRVYTVAGKVYAVSSDTGCDVIAAGVTLCHADAGVQTVFVAPSGEVTVTDDAAYVTGVDDGKVALGAAGGGRGTEAVQEQIDATIDTKLDDALNTDGDIEFVSQEATANLECLGVYLAGDLVPKGQLRSIAVPCRSNRGNMTANEVYLLVQETTGPNADFITVAVSTNAVRLIVGQTQVWQFNGEKLHGLRTRMRLVTDRDAGWDMANLLAAGYERWALRASNRRADDTESGMFMSPQHPERNTAYVAEVHFTVTGRVVKYAEKTYVEEAADGLREEIRTALSAVLSYCGSVATEEELPSGDGVRKGDVYDVRESGANFVWTGEAWDDLGPMLDGYCKQEVFEGHVGDTVAHVNAAERGRWDKAAEDAGSALSAAGAAQSTASAAQTAAEAAQGDATSALSAAQAADAKAEAASTAAEAAKSEAASAKAAAEGAAAKDSFDAHVQNTTAHLSEEEHTGLTELLASGGGGGGGGTALPAGNNFEQPVLGEEAQGAETSIALGRSARARGENSIALGRSTEVTANNAIAIGNNATNIYNESLQICLPEEEGSGATSIFFYGAGSTLASHTGGEAGMAYDRTNGMGDMQYVSLADLFSGGGGGTPGEKGDPGPYYTPSVSEDGVLSWSNNGDLPNPESVNIKGADGAPGAQGPAGPAGPAGPTGPAGQDAELTAEQTEALQFVQENQGGLQGLLDGGGALPDGNDFSNPVIGNSATGSIKSVALGLESSATGYCVAIGQVAKAIEYSTAIGESSNAKKKSVAIGWAAQTDESSIAIGAGSEGKGDYSIVIGAGAILPYKDTCLIQVGSETSKVQLYIFGQESELATKTNNEAGIGFVSGSQKGCIALSKLLPNEFNLQEI